MNWFDLWVQKQYTKKSKVKYRVKSESQAFDSFKEADEYSDELKAQGHQNITVVKER